MEIKHFVDDLEKMKDFSILTKEEFLESYNYITEEEYIATQKEIEKRKEYMRKNVRFSNRYLLCDEQEGYFDAYVFENPIEIDDLEKLIREHKENMQGDLCADWNLESIEDVIRKNYPVKDVILFEKGYNGNDIMNI